MNEVSYMGVDLEDGSDQSSHALTVVVPHVGGDAEIVSPISYQSVSLAWLKAALVSASNDPKIPALCGVRLERNCDSARMISANGSTVMVGQWTNCGTDGGRCTIAPWMDDGVTLPADGLARRLAVIEADVAQEDRATYRVDIGYSALSPHIFLESADRNVSFRLSPVPERFPDITRNVLDYLGPVLAGDCEPCDSMETQTYTPGVLKRVADVARAIGATGTSFFQGKGSPSVATFPNAPGVFVVMVPCEPIGAGHVPHATAVAIGTHSMGLAIAQTRSNLTRTVKWLETDPTNDKAQGWREKIAVYEARIAEAEGHIAIDAPAVEEPTAEVPPVPAPDAEALKPAPLPEPTVTKVAAGVSGKGKGKGKKAA
jgi:hypothetical protein